MKKTASTFNLCILTLFLVIISLSTPAFAADTAAAVATVSKCEVSIDGGDPVPIRAYIVNDENYVGLRYIAEFLGNFDVDWTQKNGITVKTETPYSGVSVMDEAYAENSTVIQKITITVNGKEKEVRAININDRYYLRLRDIAEVTDAFNVYWENNLVKIIRDSPYTGEAPKIEEIGYAPSITHYEKYNGRKPNFDPEIVHSICESILLPDGYIEYPSVFATVLPAFRFEKPIGDGLYRKITVMISLEKPANKESTLAPFMICSAADYVGDGWQNCSDRDMFSEQDLKNTLKEVK